MAEKEVFDFNQMKIPNVSPNLIKYGIVGVILLIIIFTSFYTISPEEVGVILRFGRYSHTAGPGLNFKIPFGVDNLTKVPVQRQLKKNLDSELQKPA
jgi:membrane protease subunit HflK